MTGSNGKKMLRAERLIIATGSRVRSLPGLNVDGRRVITSDEALLLRDLPAR